MGWLAIDGWLAAWFWTAIQPYSWPDGRRRQQQQTTIIIITDRHRLIEQDCILQSISRGWRPLIEAPPPPSLAGAAAPPPPPATTYHCTLVDTPVSQGADETGVPGAVCGSGSKEGSRPRAYAAAAAAAGCTVRVLCLPSCGCRYDAHNGKAGQRKKKTGAAVRGRGKQWAGSFTSLCAYLSAAVPSVRNGRGCTVCMYTANDPLCCGRRSLPPRSRLLPFRVGGTLRGEINTGTFIRRSKAALLLPLHPPLVVRGGDWGLVIVE